ncbi:hypothetical protein TMatcc_007366 [Talaromyces marneffei ATCC 18224]
MQKVINHGRVIVEVQGIRVAQRRNVAETTWRGLLSSKATIAQFGTLGGYRYTARADKRRNLLSVSLFVPTAMAALAHQLICDIQSAVPTVWRVSYPCRLVQPVGGRV